MDEVILWAFRCSFLWLAEIYIELSGVLVTIIDSDHSSTKFKIHANSEVFWLPRHLGSIVLQDHLSLKEGALRSARVDLLWLYQLDGAILHIVIDDKFSDSVIFKF